MAYLRNNTVNLLNLHYAIHALAMGGGGLFLAVFLLKAGISAPAVLVALALILVLRFTLRPLVLVLAKRVGLKPTLIFGTAATALQYPCLALVQGIDGALAAMVVTAAIGETFYWTSYHAYFATLGDREHRGHQISMREAVATIVGIVSPILGGWALMTWGAVVAFGVVAGVQVLSALPLLGTPNVAVKHSAPGVFKMARGAVLMQAADGWIAASYIFVWQIALFLSLEENFAAYGGAMAVAAIAGALAGMVLGRHIDAGFGNRAVWLSFAALAIVIVMRAASASPAMAVAANALGAVAGCLYVPTAMTAIYNLATQSPCTLRFHLATEGAWDAGCASGCIIAAALIASGVPLGWAVMTSMGGAVAVLVLLRNYYGAVPEEIAPTLSSVREETPCP